MASPPAPQLPRHAPRRQLPRVAPELLGGTHAPPGGGELHVGQKARGIGPEMLESSNKTQTVWKRQKA